MGAEKFIGDELTMSSRRMWTTEEVKYLADNYSVVDFKAIVSTLGRTDRSIYMKANKLGLTSSNYRKDIDKNIVIEMYTTQGKEVQEIAKYFDVGRHLISGIIPVEMRRNKDKIDDKEAAKMYKKGIRTLEIAKHFKVFPSSVLKSLNRSGVEIEVTGRPKVELPIRELVDLYEYGYSSIELGDFYDISSTTILSRLKETGTLIREDSSFYITGSKSVSWLGGLTSENDRIRGQKEYRNWRASVFERDNYTCQCCEDNTGGNLHSHHIYNFSEYIDRRFDLSNAMTLCDKCHIFQIAGSFHHTYGAVNNDIYQLQEYFDDIRRHLNLPAKTIESIIS